MRVKILIIFLLLILLSSCEDVNWMEVLCSSEEKNAFKTLMYLFHNSDKKGGSGGSKEKTCESVRERKVLDNCICVIDYPLRINGQCFSYSEHKENGGHISDCMGKSFSTTQYSRAQCLDVFADDKEECKKLSNNKWLQSECYVLFAKNKEDCNSIDSNYNKELNECLAKFSS